MTRSFTVTGAARPQIGIGFGYDWYVDSVAGSDSYPGSYDQPFLTLAKLQTVLTASDIAGLKRGAHWHEQLVLPANDIQLIAYGSATADPIIDCSDTISAAGWSKTGGQTNVYQVTLSPALGTNTYNSVWEDDVRLVRASSVANCDATAGSYYPSSETTAPITMYVHASDGSNPGSSGKVYEYASRKCAIIGSSGVVGAGGTNVTGITLDGIHTKRNLYNDGSIVLYRSATLQNLLVEDGTKHNLLYGGGSTLTNVEARNAYYTAEASHTYFVYNEATPNGLDITHTNCKATSTAADATGMGFFGHKNTSGSFGTVNYTDCTIENMYSGIDGQDVTEIVIDNLTATSVTNAVEQNANITLKNTALTFSGTTWRVVSVETGGFTLSVEDSTLVCSSGYPNAGYIYGGANNITINLDNVVFTDLANGRAVYLTGSDWSLTARNCDYDNTYQFYYTSQAGTLDSDYNNFSSALLDSVIAGVTYSDLGTYIISTGQDTHSTVG